MRLIEQWKMVDLPLRLMMIFTSGLFIVLLTISIILSTLGPVRVTLSIERPDQWNQTNHKER